MAMARELTDRQRQILDYIGEASREHGVPPSYREIAKHFGITAGGLQKQIKALEEKGALKRPQERSARSLQVVGQEASNAVTLPILGRVRAGGPMEAIENHEGSLSLDPVLARGAEFLLKIRGDSMEPDMVEGDLALVRPAREAQSGEPVIAYTEDGEATVKRFRRQGGEVWLEAANERYQPIRTPFKIVGKVVGLLRSYGGSR
jgi:repressor LexA